METEHVRTRLDGRTAVDDRTSLFTSNKFELGIIHEPLFLLRFVIRRPPFAIFARLSVHESSNMRTPTIRSDSWRENYPFIEGRVYLVRDTYGPVDLLNALPMPRLPTETQGNEVHKLAFLRSKKRERLHRTAASGIWKARSIATCLKIIAEAWRSTSSLLFRTILLRYLDRHTHRHYRT